VFFSQNQSMIDVYAKCGMLPEAVQVRRLLAEF
jgi:pentatricopeptide repeat protein